MTLDELKGHFNKWLEISDPHVLEVTLGSIVANRLGSNPVWLLLIAPPSGMKSELINALATTKFIEPLSDLTPKTLISGQHKQELGQEPSLLMRLDQRILSLKDFTTVLSKRSEHLDEILSQLREIYDGSFRKIWGTGKELNWEGHVGFIAGCTEAIDKSRVVHSILGERFILYRTIHENRMKIARKAIENVNRVVPMRKELAEVTRQFLLPFSEGEITLPSIAKKHINMLIELSDLTAYGRVGIIRTRQGEVSYVPTPEMPARLAQTFALLAQGIALIRKKRAVGDVEMKIIRKVAIDTMIHHRAKVMKVLFEADDDLTTTEVSQLVNLPTSTAKIYLEELWMLQCVDRDMKSKNVDGTLIIKISHGQDSAYHWKLKPALKRRLKKVKAFD